MTSSMHTDQDCVDEAARQIYIGNTGTVDFDLKLPTEGMEGTTIRWASSDDRWVTPQGKVNQPEYGRGDRNVTLTATVTKGCAEAQRNFDVTVLQLPNKIEVRKVYPIEIKARKGATYYLPMFTAVLTKNGQKVSQRVNWDEGVGQRDEQIGEHDFQGSIDGSDIRVQCKVQVVDEDPEQPVDSSPRVRRVPISRVRLTGDGMLAGNQRRRIAFLKTLDDDQLLVEFRRAAHLDTKGAKPMIGWDAPDSNLRGHTTGHVLSAYALGYAATGDEDIRAKLTYLVNGLAEVQAAFAKSGTTKPGFLSAYDESQFDKLEQYAPYPTIWAPYYTLHKILAGLIDAYHFAGNETALRVASDLGDWVYDRVHRLPHEQLQNMWSMYIAGEFGGMNESLAHLYAITGRKEHLEAARLFDNDRLMVPMRQKVDALGGLHGNQHIPQVIGSVELFRQTGLPYYLQQAEFFLKSVMGHHIYAMGGTGQGEMFQQPDVIGALLKDNTAESCASYNLLKLSALLFSFDPDQEYADYTELTTLNHIAASTDHVPQGGSLYFFPTQPGGRKEFDEENSCCHGTGLESHFYYADGAFYTDETTLWIEQYLPCSLNDIDRKIALNVDVDDRHPEKVTITIEALDRPRLALRIPAWTRGRFHIDIDGAPVSQDLMGTDPAVAVLDASACGLDSWSGTTVTLTFDPTIRLIGTPDRPSLAAVAWGPYVLAALSPSTDMQSLNIDRKDPGSAFERQGEKLIFRHRDSGLEFVPLWAIDHDQPYHAYVEVASH